MRLNDDFTGPETPVVENQPWARILVRLMREGAVPLKYDGVVAMMKNACLNAEEVQNAEK